MPKMKEKPSLLAALETNEKKVKSSSHKNLNPARDSFAGFYQSENTDANYLYSDLLSKKGVFTERIAYQTRYFIPAEKDTAKILDEIIKISPFSRVENSNKRVAAKFAPSAINDVRSAAVNAKENPSLLETLERNAEKSRVMFGRGSADGEKKRDRETR